MIERLAEPHLPFGPSPPHTRSHQPTATASPAAPPLCSSLSARIHRGIVCCRSPAPPARLARQHRLQPLDQGQKQQPQLLQQCPPSSVRTLRISPLPPTERHHAPAPEVEVEVVAAATRLLLLLLRPRHHHCLHHVRKRIPISRVIAAMSTSTGERRVSPSP